MFSKVFLSVVLFVLVLGAAAAALIRSQDEDDDDCIECSPVLEEIQIDIFNRTLELTRISWNKTTTGRQNNYFSPLISRIRFYMYLMHLYYNTDSKDYLFRDRYMEKPYALASIVEKLQRIPSIELKINMVIFYDERYTSKEYVTDVQSHYHAEIHQIPFEPKNEQRIRNNINGWIHVSTKGREQWVNENFQVAKKKPYQKAMLTFTGCWDTPKTAVDSIGAGAAPEINVYRQNRKRFAPPPVPKFATFEFDMLKEYINVEAFTAKERVGYYDNAQKRYEAIRIPFRGDEFAMVALLPYYNTSLDLLKTLADTDFRQTLRRVGETYENVHYTIPAINSTTFFINENGASLLGERNDWCYSASASDSNSPGTYYADYVQFKTFQVDRPFAVVIYHDKTALVLEYALVRNPSSYVWIPIRPKLQINVLGEEKYIDFDT